MFQSDSTLGLVPQPPVPKPLHSNVLACKLCPGKPWDPCASLVAAVQAVKVRLGSYWWSSVHSDWHLQEVSVLNTCSGLLTAFPHNDWVSAAGEAALIPASTSEEVRGPAPRRWE